MNNNSVDTEGDFPELIVKPPNGSEEVHVPLVIYIGDERKIIGEARVIGNCVEAYIIPADGNDLARMVTNGIIQDVSVSFNAPPAVPVDENGHIRWLKTY